MTEHWDKIVFIVGIIGAYITGDKKNKIFNKGGEIDNLIKYQNMYDKFASQFDKQLEALEQKITKLEETNGLIFEESESWKFKFENLQGLYKKLKSEFEALKKKHKE
tara:strand:+ start:83 stop:403 length:321 start_codon:yes stop_codon:yes gene_type:complete